MSCISVPQPVINCYSSEGVIENPSRDSHYILNVCVSVCLSVRVCTFVTSFSFSICLYYMMFQTIQTINFLKAYYLVMTMTKTETYKKTKTHRQRQTQNASKTQCMLFFQRQGFQGFKILYWLSSCDDKDKPPILCIFRGKKFSL